MAGAFKPARSLTRDDHDWGVFAQISGPRDGLSGIVAIEATFLAGTCHDFHRHPGQEEVIYVIEGTIEQWLETEKHVLSAGDSVVIPASAVLAASLLSFPAGVAAAPAKGRLPFVENDYAAALASARTLASYP